MSKQKVQPKAAVSPSSLTRGGIELFSLFGIRIYLNYTWFIIVVLVAWSLAYGYFPGQLPGRSSLLYWGLGLLTSVVFFLCILLHEIAHSYVSMKAGIPVPRITLFVFGGVAQISKEPPDPKTELRIASAGPFMSGILCAVFFALYMLFGHALKFPVAGAVFAILTIVNGGVLVFNLIPGFPLDGGRILRAYLWKRKGDLRSATRIASQVGMVFAIGLIFFGFFQLFLGNIIGGIWLAFIGFFLEQAAASGYQQVLVREGITGTRVEEIMSRKVISVKESLPIKDLVEQYFFKHRYNSYPVVRDEKFLGYVTLNHVKHLPREEWTTLKVADAMEELDVDLVLHPHSEVAEALSKMVRSGNGRLPVEKDGRLVGILTRRDIMSFLKIKTDLGVATPQ